MTSPSPDGPQSASSSASGGVTASSDINLALGNLVDDVAAEEAAYTGQP